MEPCRFVLAHDAARTPKPPRSFEELLGYARAHPGRVAYPAPPDFTGSAFVRLAVQQLGEDAAFALLRALRPVGYRGGATYPANEGALNQLFGDAMPADAPHPDAARVLANLLLDPELQVAKAHPSVLGLPTVLDPARLDAARRASLAKGAGPYLLGSFGEPLDELAAGEVPRLDARWRREVLRSPR